jgi:hypothetical protein
MSQPDPTAEILRKTREMLATANRGLADLRDADPAVHAMGIYNVAVFGRSVTLVLQKMSSVEPGFDEWYAPYRTAMAADELMRYFIGLRNEILKEGPPSSMGGSTYIEHLDGSEITAMMANPPPGAKGFFMGDALGGSGWEIELPDGSTAKYYMRLPDTMRVTVSVLLPDPPGEHAGKVLELHERSIAALCRLYVDYLERVVANAEAHFAS